jgi:hypothetical protein
MSPAETILLPSEIRVITIDLHVGHLGTSGLLPQ